MRNGFRASMQENPKSVSQRVMLGYFALADQE
jgi:hypothetical protein